jgi:hypothetical protein
MSSPLDRRDLLKLMTASAFAVMPLQLTAAGTAKLYFTADEFELLDVLTEHIIPRDKHSPGAHDAEVAAYIDRTVAEAFLPEDKQSWNAGLAEIDRLSMENHKRRFVKAGKSEQIALLKKLAKAEDNPQDEGEKFFKQLKDATIFGYYTTDIGIHKDIEYKGNIIQEQFSGYEAN